MRTLEHVLQHRFEPASRFAERLNERLGEKGQVKWDGGVLNTVDEALDVIDRSTLGRITRFGTAHYMYGMFQDPRWSPRGAAALVARIVESRPAGPLRKLPTSDYAAVSIRAGDYAELGWMLDDAYLVRALESGALKDADIVLVVGEDEGANERARRLLAGHGVRSSSLPPTTDPLLALMLDFWAIAMARSVVMSNSTFCWWATRVGQAVVPHQSVIYPDGWITGDPRSALSRALLLPEWEAIPLTWTPPPAT